MEQNLDNKYITFTIGKQKRIALIAHDGKKSELIEWCAQHKEILQRHFLCGTGTTSRLISEHTGLPVKGYNSGPLGGDQQIGAKIVEGGIDFVIFFSDPLEAQPHDPDVKLCFASPRSMTFPWPTTRLRRTSWSLRSSWMRNINTRC